VRIEPLEKKPRSGCARVLTSAKTSGNMLGPRVERSLALTQSYARAPATLYATQLMA
jgi:hypothetical protein